MSSELEDKNKNGGKVAAAIGGSAVSGAGIRFFVVGPPGAAIGAGIGGIAGGIGAIIYGVKMIKENKSKMEVK